ncbi:MAG: VCBS repeat-containing protein, partial [Acidobacteriota bacterium]
QASGKDGGHWYIRQSSDGQVIDKYWGLGTDVPVPADYDGDGKADIAVWRGAETNWYIARSSDGQTEIVSLGASWLGDVPVPGDYDGDGKTDVAVWRAGEGRWYAKCSLDGSLRTTANGQAGDIPMAAKQR